MNQEKPKPRKTYLKIFIVLPAIYAAFTFSEYQNNRRLSEEKQRQQDEKLSIIDQANQKLDHTKKILKHSLPSAESVGIGKTSNFEGPNVHIHAIVWNGTTYSEKDRHEINQNGGMLYMKKTQASLDPDHPHWGLPTLKAGLGAVEIHQPGGGVISNLMAGLTGKQNNSNKPYTVYRKRTILKDGTVGKDIEMQLYLTKVEFSVYIRPDKKSKKPKNAKEIKYPGIYYHQPGEVSLAELKPESKNYRYANLSFVLKVIPDNSPFYILTDDESVNMYGAEQKPNIAIAAFMCSKLVVNEEKGFHRVSQSVHTGSILALYPEFDLSSKFMKSYRPKGAGQLLTAEEILSVRQSAPMLGDPINPTAALENFWGREQYVWIHFDNIGSWSTGNFITGTTKTGDHVTYTFLIPVFVVGEWDVKMPTGLVEFKPEKPFVAKGFGLTDLIPSLGLGKIGKFFVIGLIGFILLFLLGGIFPPVMTIFKSILNRILSIFRPKIISE